MDELEPTMIDPNDTQTLDLVAACRRPMTPAERQRRRREKKKQERAQGVRVELAGAELEQVQQQAARVAKLEAELARLRQEVGLLEQERCKAFQAVDVLTSRLRAAGLSTDYRA